MAAIGTPLKRKAGGCLPVFVMQRLYQVPLLLPNLKPVSVFIIPLNGIKTGDTDVVSYCDFVEISNRRS